MLKELENEIKLLCPEIMEFKFGAKILIDDKLKKKSIETVVADKDIFFPRGGDYNGKSFETTDGFVDYGQRNRFVFVKVLGRDITLPDILKTIHKKYCDYLFVDTQGQFVKKLVDGEYSETGIYFDLGKPLHLQKPEVWEFLSKLILKK